MNDLNLSKRPKLCFFDSGIGGLTLLYECARKLPAADYYYFADNFNVPYGCLSNDELIEKVDGFFRQIAKLNPDAAVLGCNTATAVCAEYLRGKYTFPIIGIQPAVKQGASDGKKCVVLATPATAKSESLRNLVLNYGKEVTEVVACPDLATYIEKNIFNLNGREIMKLLPDLRADAVVLGCTHYVFVQNYVYIKFGCPVYNGLEGTANRVLQILGLKENHSQQPQITFVGGDAEKNRRVFYEILAR